jgi:uncharacterized iron-regulated membrane protein
MRLPWLRSFVFQLHRYLGLVCGLILVVIGLTGSLLVFSSEIEHQLIQTRIGNVIPQGALISIDQIFAVVRSELSRTPGLTLGNLLLPQNLTSPYQARLWDAKDHLVQLFIHPYTGQVMGSLPQSDNWLRGVLDLHYQLLGGKTGMMVAGFAALLLVILSLTGVILWPGWRKLISGFKIKLNAHPKRINFDLHKVAGIITAIFLALTGFTGFCWNFYDWSSAVIYAVTLTPKPPELVSKPLSAQSVLPASKLMAIADQALPNSITTYIGMPNKPNGVVRIGKRQFHETSEYGDSEVALDPYTGKVLRVQDSKLLALGDRVLNSFVPLHYGTFWGLPSRIFYVFVGLAPLVLFITGFVMWWYRKRKNVRLAEVTEAETVAKH